MQLRLDRNLRLPVCRHAGDVGPICVGRPLPVLHVLLPHAVSQPTAAAGTVEASLPALAPVPVQLRLDRGARVPRLGQPRVELAQAVGGRRRHKVLRVLLLDDAGASTIAASAAAAAAGTTVRMLVRVDRLVGVPRRTQRRQLWVVRHRRRLGLL